MKIGIDIDDTICSTWEIITKEMCKEFNLNYEEAIKSKKAYNDLINLSQEGYSRICISHICRTWLPASTKYPK